MRLGVLPVVKTTIDGIGIDGIEFRPVISAILARRRKRVGVPERMNLIADGQRPRRQRVRTAAVKSQALGVSIRLK